MYPVICEAILHPSLQHGAGTSHECFHDTTPMAERKFKKALSIYEFAYSIQMTEEIQLSVLQTMAIFNKLGQSHSSLNKVDKSEIWFQHLLSMIMFVTDMGKGLVAPSGFRFPFF
jgi:hypothetical protein